MTDLVYILAASHSGSTLLAMLLSTHPEICTVGELKATNLGDPHRNFVDFAHVPVRDVINVAGNDEFVG